VSMVVKARTNPRRTGHLEPDLSIGRLSVAGALWDWVPRVCKTINRSHAHRNTDRENTPDTGTHTRTTRPPNEHLPQALNNAQRWRDDGAPVSVVVGAAVPTAVCRWWAVPALSWCGEVSLGGQHRIIVWLYRILPIPILYGSWHTQGGWEGIVCCAIVVQ